MGQEVHTRYWRVPTALWSQGGVRLCPKCGEGFWVGDGHGLLYGCFFPHSSYCEENKLCVGVQGYHKRKQGLVRR